MNKISSILALFAYLHIPELDQHCSVHIVPLYKVLKTHWSKVAVNDQMINWVKIKH